MDFAERFNLVDLQENENFAYEKDTFSGKKRVEKRYVTLFQLKLKNSHQNFWEMEAKALQDKRF